MSEDNNAISNFLEELYRITGGDETVHANMHDVGSAIGFERTEAGRIAEDLMVKGLVELKTLAGNIAITREGLAHLGMAAPADKTAEDGASLSEGPVANSEDLNILETLRQQLKAAIPPQHLDFDTLEEIVIDLKTLDTQLLSPKPKIGIAREILRSIRSCLEKCDDTAEIAKKIDTLL
ncbi:hypothetical protein [Desulforhopalus singaporensis]|nr:hypothetical protein [Desulforhopalus singaporensis]